jgi:hypothetical protein
LRRIGITDKLIEGNLRARAGQQVRLIDIPADAGMGFGVFSHAGADGDAKALADTLKTAERKFFAGMCSLPPKSGHCAVLSFANLTE